MGAPYLLWTKRLAKLHGSIAVGILFATGQLQAVKTIAASQRQLGRLSE